MYRRSRQRKRTFNKTLDLIMTLTVSFMLIAGAAMIISMLYMLIALMNTV